MAITIPDSHYVGYHRQAAVVSDLPLGFATPYATDAAFEKRKDTVDSWASQQYRWGNNKDVPPLEAQILPNVLQEGFTIAKSVRRHGWNGGNVVWRVEDPRGFELEISSANFAKIVDCTTIVNGVIQGKCVWGREGASNVLLPENSEPYQSAVHATAIKKAGTISVKDIRPGSVVTLSTTAVAIYLGSLYVTGYDTEVEGYAYESYYNTQRTQRVELKLYSQKKHLIAIVDPGLLSDGIPDAHTLWQHWLRNPGNAMWEMRTVDKVQVAQINVEPPADWNQDEVVTSLTTYADKWNTYRRTAKPGTVVAVTSTKPRAELTMRPVTPAVLERVRTTISTSSYYGAEVVPLVVSSDGIAASGRPLFKYHTAKRWPEFPPAEQATVGLEQINYLINRDDTIYNFHSLRYEVVWYQVALEVDDKTFEVSVYG